MTRLLLFVDHPRKPRCIARRGVSVRRAFEELLDTNTAVHAAILRAERWWLVLAADAEAGRMVVALEQGRLPASRLIADYPNQLVIPVPQRRRHPSMGRLIAMGGAA